MDIFCFQSDQGRTIEAYGSHFTMNGIGHFKDESHINLMTFNEGDRVGRHEAPMPQLFLVIDGEGWVTGDANQQITIKAGEAAFWTKGEAHGAGTKTKMKAFVIESDSLNPERFMAVKKDR